MAFLPQSYERVLEIGCAQGCFSGAIAAGRETWGIEPSPDAARVAAERLTTVLTGTFGEVAPRLPRDHFDVVICNDVIEHMADHDQFLEIIKLYLRPGGCIVGSIPNVRFVYNLAELILLKDWRYREEGILDRTHLRFFTEKSFRRSLLEHGYRVEELRGINSSLCRSTSPKALLHMAVIAGAIAVSLGTQRDVRFLQFGFRARL
jgi:2-polyprenyl-3-methyl-5-hydroxy-6-metoxy-1,4-benzoquinol methylase